MNVWKIMVGAGKIKVQISLHARILFGAEFVNVPLPMGCSFKVMDTSIVKLLELDDARLVMGVAGRIRRMDSPILLVCRWSLRDAAVLLVLREMASIIVKTLMNAKKNTYANVRSAAARIHGVAMSAAVEMLSST